MYRIVFFRDGRKLASKPWPDGMESAKRHARQSLKIQNATLVRVIDTDTEKVVATYAENDQPAP